MVIPLINKTVFLKNMIVIWYIKNSVFCSFNLIQLIVGSGLYEMEFELIEYKSSINIC